MAGQVEVLVDGNLATLVDLSPIGAQVRVADRAEAESAACAWRCPTSTARCASTRSVAWASFEIPKNADPRYRAGIEFVDADKAAVNAYLARHKQS